jgi:hypothetical protein
MRERGEKMGRGGVFNEEWGAFDDATHYRQKSYPLAGPLVGNPKPPTKSWADQSLCSG